MSQTIQILHYMQEHGGITTMEAFSELGITRLASRIHDLSQEGYDIKREMVSGKNRFGDNVHYMRYWV